LKAKRNPLKSQLLEAAKLALGASYSPYSKCKVASAVLTDDGQIYSGCNIENASYGATVCAERVAIWKAVSQNQKRILAILVLTPINTPWSPCGLCRQVLREFADSKCPVFLAGKRGITKTFTLGQLLPQSFSPKNLGR